MDHGVRRASGVLRANAVRKEYRHQPVVGRKCALVDPDQAEGGPGGQGQEMAQVDQHVLYQFSASRPSLWTQFPPPS